MSEHQDNELTAEEKKAKMNALYNEKIVGNFTRKELDTIRATYARGTTNEEFGLFIQKCINMGLNPFMNHINCIIYGANNPETRKINIQVTSEGIMHLARKNPGFKGIDVQMIHENDEFLYDGAKKEVIKWTIGFPRGKIVGCFGIARHAEYPNKVVLMDASEVEHMKKGPNGKMWNNWFADMFKKHVIIRIAKEQYGLEIPEDFIPEVPVPEEQPLDRMDITPVDPGVIEIEQGERISEKDKLREIWQEIESNVTGDIITVCMKKYFKGKTEQDLQLKDVVALKKFCQLEQQQNMKKQQRESEFVQEPEFIKKPVKVETEEDEFSLFFD